MLAVVLEAWSAWADNVMHAELEMFIDIGSLPRRLNVEAVVGKEIVA